MERWTRQQSVIAYWIIGNFFGKAVSNNKKVRCPTAQLPCLSHNSQHRCTYLWKCGTTSVEFGP